jgi:SH3 domain protein
MVIVGKNYRFFWGKIISAHIFQAFGVRKRISMKRLMIIGLSLFCLTSECWAETAYISQILSITMRSGPGTGYETVSTIKTGEKVEVIQQGNGWTHVQSQDGKEGWVSARYLTTEAPADQSLADLKAKYQDFAALESENQRLQSVIVEKEQKIGEMQQAYEKLKADSSDFMSVQKKLDAALAELSKMKENSGKLGKTIDDLQNDRILKGALIGAGILLLGILIGLNFKKQRRRSSLL